MNRTPRALLFFIPFLCGFQFYSALQNEEGNKLYGKGQVGKAKSAYESALKSEPSSPEIAFNLGNAYYKGESFDKSLEAYKKAAEDKKSPLLQSKAFYNLGNSLFRRKETDKAIEFYKQALRLNPKDEDAKYNLELLTQREDQKQNQQQDQKQNQQQQQDKQEQKQSQGGNQGSEGQDQKDQKENQDQKDKQDQKQDQGGNQGSGGQDQKDQNQDQKEKPKQGQSPQPADQSEEGREEQRPKTQAEIRAEQILNALENEEKQVLKMEGGQKNPSRKTQYLVDKDW